MPRGRPAIGKTATKFLNSKRRVIYYTANGKYLAKSNKGTTVYAPKARYVKSPGGTTRSLLSSGARVPPSIRPKAVRKIRANRGKARPKSGATYANRIGPKRPVGRPRRRLVSPAAALGLAKLFREISKRPARKRKSPLQRLMASLN